MTVTGMKQDLSKKFWELYLNGRIIPIMVGPKMYYVDSVQDSYEIDLIEVEAHYIRDMDEGDTLINSDWYYGQNTIQLHSYEYYVQEYSWFTEELVQELYEIIELAIQNPLMQRSFCYVHKSNPVMHNSGEIYDNGYFTIELI